LCGSTAQNWCSFNTTSQRKIHVPSNENNEHHYFESIERALAINRQPTDRQTRAPARK